ncbi:hypothetical protein ACO0QE_002338 [Hanseniaspora vineae]
MAVIRYTEEELLELQPLAVVPKDFDPKEFNDLVAKVSEILALREEEYEKHHPFSNRRRSSHHFNARPKVHKHKPKVTTDADGWSSLDTEKPEKTSFAFSENNNNGADNKKLETVKVRPNNKNISSSRPADSRDIIADKNTVTFNAFAALESDEEE